MMAGELPSQLAEPLDNEPSSNLLNLGGLVGYSLSPRDALLAHGDTGGAGVD